MVAHALGAIKSEKAIEPLLNLLKDKDLGVSRKAAEALGAILDSLKNAEQLKALHRVVESGYEEIRFYESLKTIRYIPDI